MLRKVARERREYLYRKSLEGKEKEEYEKKRKLRKALAEGAPVPTELLKEKDALMSQMELEDEFTAVPTARIDDEYARAGIEDPKILLTTSHSPSTRLIQFAKEMKLLLPNATRVNRGKSVLPSLVEACRKRGFTDLIILHATKGEPNGLIISHMPYGPTAYFGIYNPVLRHEIREIAPMKQAYPHLIFNGFETKLGERIMSILKYIFPVPAKDSQRVVTLSNDNDYISFRNHYFKKVGKNVELSEMGPRFELKPYQILLGTADQKQADVEWSLKPYQRTAKKRNLL